MKAFNHVKAKSLAEAGAALADGKTILIAGGTDLIGTLKDNILLSYPSTLVNIKTVPGLDVIKEEGGMLKMGAATRLADIAANPAVADARPLPATRYKVQIAKTLVKRALLATV
jgi:xanthine dehydrogenase YagS FAD-binding subunit